MSMNQEIAKRLDMKLDDDLVICIEGACITRPEWEANPDGCLQRVRGVMEELDDVDF